MKRFGGASSEMQCDSVFIRDGSLQVQRVAQEMVARHGFI